MLCRCARCLEEKAPSDFYANDRTCKECRKAAVRANRMAKIEYYRSYEKMRASVSHRVAARLHYAQTQRGKEAMQRARVKYRSTYPERRAAHIKLNNALKRGKVQKFPCFICGLDAEAHHPDYSMPLDVVWLCRPHHQQAHALAEECV